MDRGDHPVVLFVSTGRCGTQWLADALGTCYSDVAEVEHEPIGPAYQCKRFFRSYEDPRACLEVTRIRRHLTRVRQTLRTRSYIETGWPLFSAVPAFVAELGRAVRLVHLTRHPVPSSISHMVHKTYAGSPRVDGYTTAAALDPWSHGVVQRDLQARWRGMSPYEKTLFWWTEVHHYADELAQRYPDVPFHRVRAEDLLSPPGDALLDLCEFMGLPRRPQITERIAEPVDRWHHKTDDTYDWSLIYDYPLALDVAARLGYDVADVEDKELSARYSTSVPEGG